MLLNRLQTTLSACVCRRVSFFKRFFFFNDPATTDIYPLPQHDALPISATCRPFWSSCTATKVSPASGTPPRPRISTGVDGDRKSTRLNSSHGYISYAVFCLKKKKIEKNSIQP